MLDLESGKIKDFAKFDVGNVCMVTGGHNNGRVGVVVRREKHKGAFDIVHIEDSAGNTFATRITNVFVIGKGKTPLVSLPKVCVRGRRMGQRDEMNECIRICEMLCAYSCCMPV